MNPEEVKYSFPCYQYETSGVWYDKENESITAFLGNFHHSYDRTPDKDPALNENSVSCVAASSLFPLQDSVPELSENCSVQVNKNTNSEIKTGIQSKTPEVTKTEPKAAMPKSVNIELPAPKKSERCMERRKHRQRTVPYWKPTLLDRKLERSLYNSLRFKVYGFLTHHHLWYLPVAHPMIPRWVQDTIWAYDMEQEWDFRNHKQWMSLDYFPNHTRNCRLCMDYRGPFLDV